MARVLTGIQSSGSPHLGNILGAMSPAIQMSNDPQNEGLYFIADLHSLTTIKEAEQRRYNTQAVAAAWIALGFDYNKNILFRQSDNCEVTELTWYLSCYTPFPMLANAHSFKDKSDRLADVNAGLFTYPVLMAADILLYDVNIVPVGKDQQQHLEMTRDIARAFNNKYGEIFVVPEAKINEEVMVIPGTDGQKMSKSYGNFVDVFADEKILKKQIMSIVTDAKTLEEPKDPDACNVFALYRLVANNDDVNQMKEKYTTGNYGYGHAKKALLEILMDKFNKERAQFSYLMQQTDELEKILKSGSEKARIIGNKVLDRTRDVLGFKAFD